MTMKCFSSCRVWGLSGAGIVDSVHGIGCPGHGCAEPCAIVNDAFWEVDVVGSSVPLS